jgi:hypothetical protein
MIPARIIRFLEERANIGFAGTRDSNLVPSGHRVSGWQTDGAGRRLTTFIPLPWANRLLESLLSNGAIAVTIEEAGTHETYQFKGRYLSHRPVQNTEIAIASRARERFVKGLHFLFPDERMASLVKASIPTPSLAVEIEVHEVFLQTPGPGAGSRIAPAPDADVSPR